MSMKMQFEVLKIGLEPSIKLINGQQLPVVMTFALDLLVQITPDRQKNNYSTTNFVNGRAYSEGFI